MKALSTSLLGSEQQEAQNCLGHLLVGGLCLGFRQRVSVTARREHFVPLGPYLQQQVQLFSIQCKWWTNGRWFSCEGHHQVHYQVNLILHSLPPNPHPQKVVTLRWIIPSHCLGTWEVRMLPVFPAECPLCSSFPSSPSRCPRTSSNNYVDNASRVPKS